ncbi:hypothetical protein Pla123a_21880 [Posidoniimonas polymericola]|uniref:PEP-CTERM protein-sorting domain-containing protein n=1 Tax=Posidoniimonas polymericola TaxID=2528002 RepID=A0A5C5YS54_9BACT|nr:PEP-CTERM sorting domain-containing protein [Posidoniimonas polymericola]TWT77527.1 hypothetical protein Pla123a_21880 [Posidoniimonas polymericola]
MPRPQRLVFLSIGLLSIGWFAASAEAITRGQRNWFFDGLSHGWESPTGPASVQYGDGDGHPLDHYITYTSTGGNDLSGRLLFRNSTEWVGDYNLGGSPLYISAQYMGPDQVDLYLTITSGDTTFAVSQFLFTPLSSGYWTAGEMYFPLGEFDIDTIVKLAGDASLADVVSQVTETRLIASTSLPVMSVDGPVGDLVSGTLRVSELRFLPIPEPGSATLLFLAIGASAARRPRR